MSLRRLICTYIDRSTESVLECESDGPIAGTDRKADC